MNFLSRNVKIWHFCRENLNIRVRRKWFWVNSGSEKVPKIPLPCSSIIIRNKWFPYNDSHPNNLQFGLVWMRETRSAVEEAANGGKTIEVGAGQVQHHHLYNQSICQCLFIGGGAGCSGACPHPWPVLPQYLHLPQWGHVTCLSSTTLIRVRIRIRDQDQGSMILPCQGHVTSLKNLQCHCCYRLCIIFAKTDTKKRHPRID